MKILNLKNIKILNSNTYRHIQAKNIFTVDHPWYYKGKILDEVNNMPEWIITWLRSSFLQKDEKFLSNEKIFIDRSESKYNHCQIINNNEVSKFVKANGFTSYKVGQLSFQKQIHLFKNAKIIVGAHGAAFANLTFCNPQTKVIELKPDQHPNFINRKISNYIGLDYKLIETPIIKKNDYNNGDMYVDLNILKKFI